MAKEASKKNPWRLLQVAGGGCLGRTSPVQHEEMYEVLKYLSWKNEEHMAKPTTNTVAKSVKQISKKDLGRRKK